MITRIEPAQTELIEKVARLFAAKLRHELGPHDMAAVIAANLIDRAAGVRGICHSHDKCDANMVMHDALTDALGDEPDIGGDCQNIVNLFNDAWQMAYNNDFFGGSRDE